jgi:predicted TIM-barrel fold metal-dependent hydrolase
MKGTPDMDRYMLISSDGHAGPPAEHYRDYLDAAYHGPFDQHQKEMAEMRALMQRDERFAKEWAAKTGDGGLTAAFDSDARNEKLDTEGVVAEVLFPDADVMGTGRVASSPFGSGLGSSGDSDPDLVMAGAKAHNRWLADFCAKEPHRRIGVAVVPILHDLAAAVDEIRAVADLGLRGVMIPTRWMNQPAYHDAKYDPVWAAIVDAGLVMHTHSGAGPTDYDMMQPGSMAIYASEAYWWAARPLWVLIWGGVFERHPGLRYVVAENGAWWLPDILTKMDEKFLGGHNTKKMAAVFHQTITKPPSEYFRQNCYLAASTPGVEDIERRHLVGVGNLLWGNDFPHPEGTFPYTRELVRQRFKDVPTEETRRILGLNAAGLYGVDVAALAPLVEQVGPRVDQVHSDEPLQAVPA